MKILALVLILATSTSGQPAPPSVAGFWTAQFEGHTFLRLELKSVNGAITGGMSIGDIEVDQQGGLRRVKEAPSDLTPISDVTDHQSRLTFSRKDGDGDDTDRFELRVIDASHAELTFLLSDAAREDLAANGVPVPKPIALSKQ